MYDIDLFIDRLNHLLEMNDMNVFSLSKQVGISQSWFSDVLNKKKINISLENTCKIADFFEVSITYFIDNDKNDIENNLKVVNLIEENLKLRNKISKITEVLSDE